MNVSFGGIAVLILALAGAGVAIALARLLWRVTKVVTELEVTARNLNRLAPRIERFMDTVEAEVSALHSVTGRVDRIAAAVENVTSRAVTAGDDALRRFEGLSGSVRTIGAAAAGIAAGVAAFTRRRHNSQRDAHDDAPRHTRRGAPPLQEKEIEP